MDLNTPKKKMEKPLTLNIQYGTEKKTIVSSRKDLIDMIKKSFDLPKKSRIILEQKLKGSKKWIPVKSNDVVDISLLRFYCIAGRSSNSIAKLEAKKVKSLSVKDLVLKEKLKTNSVLSGSDRKYLTELLSNVNRNDGNNKKTSIDAEMQTELTSEMVEKALTAKAKKVQTCSVGTSAQTESAGCRDVMELLTYMQQENRKHASKKDINNIKRVMAATFPDRRDFIIRSKPKVITVKELYPCLFNITQVIIEFEHILGFSAKDRFLNNLNDYSFIILEMAPSSIGIKQKAERAMKDVPNMKQFYADFAALLIMPYLLNESSLVHFQDDTFDEGDIFPRLTCIDTVLDAALIGDGTFNVTVENTTLCDDTNFKLSFLALLACFFIFDICYPDDCKQTMLVFERLFLDLRTDPLSERAEQVLESLIMTKKVSCTS